MSIFNFQLFRHVERPGWTLRWTWRGDEVIWSMSGAEATEQGNCTRFRGEIPHSCEKEPVIIDLLPDSPYSIQVANCCKGGVLSSMMQDPGKYGAVFLMNVGIASNAYANGTNTTMPVNFTLGVPGYTCGKPSKVPPSRFNVDQGRRRTQALCKYIKSSTLIMHYMIFK